MIEEECLAMHEILAHSLTMQHLVVFHQKQMYHLHQPRQDLKRQHAPLVEGKENCPPMWTDFVNFPQLVVDKLVVEMDVTEAAKNKLHVFLFWRVKVSLECQGFERNLKYEKRCFYKTFLAPELRKRQVACTSLRKAHLSKRTAGLLLSLIW